MLKKISPSKISGTITAPTSKSYAQRAIAAALLADGISCLTNMDLCNDTVAAIDTARKLGAEISNEGATYTIKGGFSPRESTLNIGESGLATRLFTPIAALSNRQITIVGSGSIMTRPIEAMCQPLEQLGVEVETNNGFLPLTVKGSLKGGEVTADGSLSSQFISGLLTALPLAQNDTILNVINLQSVPYVDMTIEVLRHFGVSIEHSNYKKFRISGNQRYKAADYNIEGDWSGASCMLVAGAIAGEITINNLNPRSLQADRKIVEALMDAEASMTLNWDSISVRKGRLKGFIFDAMNCPDLFPALVALAANCEGETKIVGTERLIHKESNRALALASEFGKLGIIVDISECNIMRIERGTQPTEMVVIDSHNDHRIAMATAVAALALGVEVTIEGAEAVDKSYPEFWEELAKISG